MSGPGFIHGRNLPVAWFKKRPCDKRLMLIRVLIAIIFVLFVLRIFQLQIEDLRSDKPTRSAAAKVRRDIVDRNNDPLAINIPVYELCINGRDATDPKTSAANLRKIMPSIPAKNIEGAFALGKKCAVLSRSVSKADMDRIIGLRDPLSPRRRDLSFEFVPREERHYPHGNLFAHVLGGLNKEGRGVLGIEKYLDDNKQAYEAAPLKLSVDRFVQQVLHTNLSDALLKYNAIAAAGGVVDAKTGEVVALVSLPDFPGSDANSYALSVKHRNKVASEVYEMGSVLKIFNHALAVEHNFDQRKTFDVKKPVKVGSFTIRDSHFYKSPLTFDEAFYYSSNRASVAIAEEIGLEKQTEFFQKLGFFDRLNFELPVAKPIRAEWTKTTGRTVSYGNGLAVSLLHIAAGMNAMVGGGMYIDPTILKRPDDTPFYARQVVKEKTSEAVRRLLGLVITEGTGKAAASHDFIVGGKTGTMLKRAPGGGYDDKRTMNFFAASIPLDSPRYTVVVMLDEPRNGACIGAGCTAAPTARKILDELTPLLIR